MGLVRVYKIPGDFYTGTALTAGYLTTMADFPTIPQSRLHQCRNPLGFFPPVPPPLELHQWKKNLFFHWCKQKFTDARKKFMDARKKFMVARKNHGCQKKFTDARNKNKFMDARKSWMPEKSSQMPDTSSRMPKKAAWARTSSAGPVH